MYLLRMIYEEIAKRCRIWQCISFRPFVINRIALWCYLIHVSRSCPELPCEIFCFQSMSHKITVSRFNASTISMERIRRGITLATNAATYLHEKTIYTITSSSNAVSCQGSTALIVHIARSIPRMCVLIYAGYIPINEFSS
jgi:hypothetical protein